MMLRISVIFTDLNWLWPFVPVGFSQDHAPGTQINLEVVPKLSKILNRNFVAIASFEVFKIYESVFIVNSTCITPLKDASKLMKWLVSQVSTEHGNVSIEILLCILEYLEQ